MNRIFVKACFLGLILLAGCSVPTSTAMDGTGGRNAYNIAVEKTNSEEMLLNIVRIKYFDVPYFLEVGTITSQYTYKSTTSANLPIPGFSDKNPFKLGGELSWQNQPTIQYSPISGQDFTEHLLFPIRLTTIQQLIYTGWDINRVFRLIIQEFDQLLNSPLGATPGEYRNPQYASFYEATNIMRQFQKEGKLRIGVRYEDCKDTPDQKTEVLQIAFPADDERGKKLAEMLQGEEQEGDKYIIHLRQGFNKYGQIGVMSRSLLSCIYYLGLGVEVPQKDEQDGLVIGSEIAKKEILDVADHLYDLIHVRSCDREPKNCYVKIFYRNHWFYIDDTDLNSKRTFILLMQLYQLQASPSSKNGGLVLTLPIGG